MDLQGLSFNRQAGDIKLKPDASLKLQAGDVVRGLVQAITSEGLVQLLVRGKSILAEAQIPLQAGQELYLQADRMENGKLYLRAVDPQAQAELPELALRGMLTKLGLKSDELTAAVARKLIAYNLPVSKDNIEAVVKMASLLPNSDTRTLEAGAFALSRGNRISHPERMASLVEFFSSPQAREQLNQVISQLTQGDSRTRQSAPENKLITAGRTGGMEISTTKPPSSETIRPGTPLAGSPGLAPATTDQLPKEGRMAVTDQQGIVSSSAAKGDSPKAAAGSPVVASQTVVNKEPAGATPAVPPAAGTTQDAKPAPAPWAANSTPPQEPGSQVYERQSAPAANLMKMPAGLENTAASNSRPGMTATPMGQNQEAPPPPARLEASLASGQPGVSGLEPGKMTGDMGFRPGNMSDAQALSRLLTPLTTTAGTNEATRPPDANLESVARRLGELIKPALERLITDLDQGKPDANQLKQVIKDQQALLPDIKYARQVLEHMNGAGNHPLHAALEKLEQEWSGQTMYNRLETNSLRDQSNLYITLPLRWQERLENAEICINWRRDNRNREMMTDSLTVNIGLNTINLGTVIFHLRTQGRQLGLSVYLENEEAKIQMDRQMPELVAQLANLGYTASYMGSQVVRQPNLRPEFVDETAADHLPPVTGLDLKI